MQKSKRNDTVAAAAFLRRHYCHYGAAVPTSTYAGDAIYEEEDTCMSYEAAGWLSIPMGPICEAGGGGARVEGRGRAGGGVGAADGGAEDESGGLRPGE